MALDGRSKLRGRRRWAAVAVVAAVAVAAVGVEFLSGGAASAAAPPQAYDLTVAPYCGATTGQATIALNSNLISNPGAEYATERGAVPGGAGTMAGSTVPDPDGVLLPGCWAITSSIAGSAPTNEIASAVAASYPGSSGTGTKNFYGGKSANDAAAAGTVTTASQTISLSRRERVLRGLGPHLVPAVPRVGHGRGRPVPPRPGDVHADQQVAAQHVR